MSKRDIVEALSDSLHAFVRRIGLSATARWPSWFQRKRNVPRRPPHPFDRKFNVDTGGLAYADVLATGHAHDRYSSGYYATAPSLFHGAISIWQSRLSGSPYALSNYAFLDAGCGKGRVLMLASEYSFRKIVGVELNPKLAEIANRNLSRWHRAHRGISRPLVEISDILQVPLPTGPILLFLFNSFELEIVQLLLERLQQLSASRHEPIDLIYIHPDYGQMVRQVPRMQLLADAEIAFSKEDAAADLFGVAADRCSVFRLPGMQPLPDPLD